MQVTYDRDVDVLRLVFRKAKIRQSDESKPGVILDYDRADNIVGLEILNASKRVDDVHGVDFSEAG